MAIEYKIGSHIIEVSSPDKILFPHAKITKEEFVDYYERISSIMLPHIKNRPITMHRFPNGIEGQMFYQKDIPDYFPSFIKRVAIEKGEGGVVRHALCNNAASLVYLASQVCVPHVWLSRVNKLEYPDRMIFDLDPSPGVEFKTVRWAAKKIKELLDSLSLPNFVMTTGSRGLHVVVPLKPKQTFDQVRAYSQTLAQKLVDDYPDKLTLEIRKAKRGKRIFVDTLRNAWAQTGVAPYAVRAKEDAPIATPVEWEEVFKKRITPQQFNIKNIFKRLARKEDPWKNIDDFATTLKK